MKHLVLAVVLAGCLATPPETNDKEPEHEDPVEGQRHQHDRGWGGVRIDLYPEGDPGSLWRFCMCGELDLAAPDAEISVELDGLRPSAEHPEWERVVSYPDQPTVIEEWFDVQRVDEVSSAKLSFYEETAHYTIRHSWEIEVEPDGDGFQVTVWDGSRNSDGRPDVYHLP